jgi:ketosteroid isomerase-like protein
MRASLLITSRLITPALIMLLVCAGMPVSYAQNSDSDASKIIAMEHVWAQAYIAKDPKALGRILDDEFVCVSSDGRLLNKAQTMADVKTSTTLQILTESMVVHLHGDTAIVSGVFRTKGIEHGKLFTRRERFVDTWFNKNGLWVSLTSLVSLGTD